MTVKATSVLSILAIWVASIAAVVIEPDSWWILIFSSLATGAVGVSAWRRLGISRLLAIAGTWGGTAIAASSTSDAAWTAIFAFLATGAVANSRNETGRGVAALIWWGVAGAIVLIAGDGWAWLGVIAFILTSISLGFGDFSFPRGVEWDLWDRDDDDERVKVVR